MKIIYFFALFKKNYKFFLPKHSHIWITCQISSGRSESTNQGGTYGITRNSQTHY